jgi:hypothetical protein
MDLLYGLQIWLSEGKISIWDQSCDGYPKLIL